jgi:ferredoxin
MIGNRRGGKRLGWTGLSALLMALLGLGCRQTASTESDWARPVKTQVVAPGGEPRVRSERCAKIAAAMRGRSPPPHLLKALHEGNRGRRHSEETRRKMSETHRRLGTRPPHGREWRPDRTHWYARYHHGTPPSGLGARWRQLPSAAACCNCPTGAVARTNERAEYRPSVSMVQENRKQPPQPPGEWREVPVVDETKCTGCGLCCEICPTDCRVKSSMTQGSGFS